MAFYVCTLYYTERPKRNWKENLTLFDHLTTVRLAHIKVIDIK